MSSVYNPQGISFSRVSLRDGSRFNNTNNLYQPLKETLTHPEIVRQHQELTPVIAQSSLVSKQYKRLNTLEFENLERNTFIPDAELIPTGNLDRVRGETFVAVDAVERVAGPPISQAQMDRIRMQGMKSSQVVYEIREQPVKVVPVTEVPYTTTAYQNYGKKQEDYKYNLFSCIDQPVNECRTFGCGKCTGCPSNEIIARENHRPTLSRN